MIKIFKYFHTQFQDIKTPSSLKLNVKAFEYSYNTNFNCEGPNPMCKIKKLLGNGLQLHGLKTKRESNTC